MPWTVELARYKYVVCGIVLRELIYHFTNKYLYCRKTSDITDINTQTDYSSYY